MRDEKPMSPVEHKALQAEMTADYGAARARDYGQADAATYDQRVSEGASSARHIEPEPADVSPADIERAVAQVERHSLDQQLNEAAARMAAKPKERGRER
jgi:hypothetical protein